MPTDKQLITHPNYGSRRLEGTYTEISLNQEYQDKVPTHSDILLDFGLGKKRLFHHLGRAMDEDDRPGTPLGFTSRRFRLTHYDASLCGAPAQMLGMILDSEPYIGQAGRNPGSGFATGALFDTNVNNIILTDSLYPFDTGIPGYRGAFSGLSYETGTGARLRAGTSDRDDVIPHFVKCGTASSTDDQTFRVRQMNKALVLDFHRTGRNSAGFAVRGFFTPTIRTGSIDFKVSTPLLDATSTERRQALGDLASRMIITPDEYLHRNDQAIIDLSERLHDMLIEDYDYHMQKGKRGSWTSRISDSAFKLLGELQHLGMSLRLGKPVQNCYADVTMPPTTRGTTIRKDKSDASSASETRNMIFGHAFLAGASSTSTADESVDTLMEEAASIDFDSTRETNPLISATTAIDPSVDIPTLADPSTTAACTIGLVSVNASVSPWFLDLPDVSYELAEDGTVLDDSELKGYFACLPELALQLTPGMYTQKEGVKYDRSQQWNDFIVGFEWLFAHCSADQAAAYATLMRSVRENWADFKNGTLVSVYEETDRVSTESLRHAWNLRQNVTAPLQDGVAPDVSVANIQRFYSDGGFIDTNQIDMWKQSVDRLSQKNYPVSPNYNAGLQNVGDAKYTAFHRTAYDGTEHSIDVTLMPHAFGHWSNVPAVWNTGSGNIWIMNLDSSASPINAVYSRAVNDNFIGSIGDKWSIETVLQSPVVRTRISGHESTNSPTNLNIGALSFVFPGLLNADKTAIEPLSWKHLTPLFSVESLPSNVNSIGGLNFGSDPHGYTEATHRVVKTTGDTCEYQLLTEANTSFEITGVTPRWHDRFARMVTAVNHARGFTPYKANAMDLKLDAVNLVAIASFNTGEPALQQMGDSIFTLAFCGQNGGWSIDTRTVDRKLWDESIHRYSHFGDAYQGDYAAWFIPRSLDTSKLLTSFAATHLVNMNLGLIGAEHRSRDNAHHYRIDFVNVRTIYRNTMRKNGQLIDKAITRWGEHFRFDTDTPLVLDHNYIEGVSSNDVATTNQFRCQPGSNYVRRLFRHLGAVATPSSSNSVCGMFGLVSDAHVDNSRLGADHGIEGFSAAVPDATIDTLHAMTTAGLRRFEKDGTTGEKQDYWATTDATLTGADIKFGDLPTQSNIINFDFIKVMVERNRGTDNLYFTEADLRIAFVDQDIFDQRHAYLSCLHYVYDRTMILGPTPHVIVFDKQGSVVYEAKDVLDFTGAGQAAVASTSSSVPSEAPPSTDDDSDYEDDSSSND